MTRDTQRRHDEPDLSSDAATYAALWELSPFPRLPDHAPEEIKNLTIEIHDPKRVYTIHQAARRHQFHLLVERYILQIRYGCQSTTCATTTCFSCRRRLAAGAPVRRYNATSARTLAVYMASQDNPEQELCRNAQGEQPNLKSRITKSKKGVQDDTKVARISHDGLSLHGENGASAKTVVSHRSNSTRSMSNGPTNIGEPKKTRKKASDDSLRSRVQVLDEPTKMDHRSFVQNVFGSAAFKMVEWLTPRNFQKLSTSEDYVAPDNAKPSPKPTENLTEPTESSEQEGTRTDEERQKATSDERVEPDPVVTPVHQEKENIEPSRNQESKPPNMNRPRTETNQSLDSFPKSTMDEKSMPKRRSSHVRTSSESLEHHRPKTILNVPQKPAEIDTSHFTVIPNRQKLVRQAVLTSPALREEDSPPPDEFQVSRPVAEIEKPRESVAGDYRKVERHMSTNGCLESNKNERKKRAKRSKHRQSRIQKNAPQSLSSLSVETMQILCDILQSNGIYEKHTLHPQTISDDLIKELFMPGVISTTLVEPVSLLSLTSQSEKLQWQQFAEQSLFDVLSRPVSLLRSFHRDDKFLDTQAIWYLMLRMTRVAPSLVLDSLWRTSESLFQSPKLLEDTYDWPRHLSTQGIKAVSNKDAAKIISLCLHALVASVPLVRDARKLANMSRIRSHGSSTRGREVDEPVDLCLQYDDAFTNDNAMRLARRLFAAIPTRRAFAELVSLQSDPKENNAPKPEILDTVLATLKLEPKSFPHIKFSDLENNLHEPRMYVLVLDWARTVMLQEWQGSAVVPRDGPFGGALMTMAAMYKNRKSLLLGDIHFQTQYFSERLDPINMPREWISYEPNKKTVHLLDYPYLFNPSTLVTYFRSINFSKMNYAYETSRATCGLITTAMAGNHSLMANKERWDRLVEMMRTATSQFLVLEIRRSNILQDTFNAIWRREERELMRPIKLRLSEDGGDEGLDHGGVQQEFFGLAIAEALNPDYGTFTIDERTKMAWFQPGSLEPLWKFELIGTIVSLAVYNGLTLPVTFPKALYRRLLEQDVTELHHIEDGWPSLASGLTTLLEWNENEGSVEEIFSRTYEFSVEQFGQTVSREMSPSNTNWPQFCPSHPPSASNPEDAPLVTGENRNSYVSDYIRWLTDVSVRPQFEAFKRGFFTCISPQVVKLFDPSTLQSVVEGIQDIDVAELRHVTRYVGWDASHPTVRQFWSIVKTYDLDQKRKLLEFVTASDRVPVGGVRNMQFTLQKNGMDDLHLPTSYTCFGILLLPEFSSREILREKLAVALENSRGFGFS